MPPEIKRHLSDFTFQCINQIRTSSNDDTDKPKKHTGARNYVLCAFWIKLTTRISLKKSHSLYIKLCGFVLLGGVLVNIFLNSFKQYLILSVFYCIHIHSRLLSERLGALFKDPVIFVLVLLLIGLWWGFYYV